MSGYEPLIQTLKLPDPDDRHVLAAAIRCGAQHIVTENLKDFPNEVLEPFEIEAIGADEFLKRTYELYPEAATEVLSELRSDYKNPPYSVPEFLMDITARGMPKLAAAAKEYEAFL